MVESPKFDVFLAHNSADKPQVRAIASELRKRGLKPWLDEEQIPPGELFQEAIQRAIPQIESAAICIGPQGLGKWQVIELQALISQFINKGSRVIPVLLPGVDNIPDNLLFLKQFNGVNFKDIDDDTALAQLEWGITDIKHRPRHHPIVTDYPIVTDSAREHPISVNPLIKVTRILGLQSIIESIMGKNEMLPSALPKIKCYHCGRINNVRGNETSFSCRFCGTNINVAARSDQVFNKIPKIKCYHCGAINNVRGDETSFSCRFCGTNINVVARSDQVFF